MKRRKKYRQTGTSDYKRDRRLRAKLPGKRIIIHSGKKRTVYYEYRRNRSDANRKRRI